MEKNKNKEGISVKEIEGFVKQHRFKAFLITLFVLAGIFGMGVIWSAFWSILCVSAGGIIGVLFPDSISKLAHHVLDFIFKQDPSTQLIFACIWLIIAILLSPLVFFLVGAHAGRIMYTAITEKTKTP